LSQLRYWWVNQNQTYRHEVPGGYLWSPKRKANNHRNAFYDMMREVAPGDVIFSFADTRIPAIGIAGNYAYEAPKPSEFGTTGAYWNNIGWRVDVRFHELQTSIRPAAHIEHLRPVMPTRYAPLDGNGRGYQHVYLTLLPLEFAAQLIDLIGREARDIVQGLRIADEASAETGVGQLQWEEFELNRVRDDKTLDETDRQALVIARRGQGLFKRNVMRIEQRCRITGITREEHLRASHCKPWRDATNAERLDGENGLLLTPNADHLFDRGFISFDDNGDVLVSPVAHQDSVVRLGIDPMRRLNVGRFSGGQRKYLEYHRKNVLLESKYLRTT